MDDRIDDRIVEAQGHIEEALEALQMLTFDRYPMGRADILDARRALGTAAARLVIGAQRMASGSFEPAVTRHSHEYGEPSGRYTECGEIKRPGLKMAEGNAPMTCEVCIVKDTQRRYQFGGFVPCRSVGAE